MPTIHILEKSPCYVSGLLRAFPESQETIVYSDNVRDFLELQSRSPNGLAVIDLDSLPEQGISAVCALNTSGRNQQVILLVNRSQKAIIWEVMQAGCLCYLEKPVSMRILSQLCQRIFSRNETDSINRR